MSLSDFADSHIEGSYKTTADLLILTTSAGETFVFRINDSLICLDLACSTADLSSVVADNGFHDGIELCRNEPEGNTFLFEGVYEAQGEQKSLLKLEGNEFEWTFSSPEATVLNGSYAVDINEGCLYLFLENAENYCFRIIEDGTYRLELDLSIGWMPGTIYHVPKSMDKMVFIQQGQQN